jgi:6-phosphofructokinase 1
MIKRIGILTGGGDCPGLNAVIRAVAKALMHEHGYKIVGFLDGYDGLVCNRTRNLEWSTVWNILSQGGTIIGTSNKANPFASREKTNGTTKTVDRSDRAMEVFAKHNLDGLVMIGGDGSLAIAGKLLEKGMPIVGVPKTIDNDVPGTELTFGFQSAVDVATDALDRLHTTASSHHRVMVAEVMGRYAGWIALHAGIASGADIILIPEISFRWKPVIQTCRLRAKRGNRFSIICVAEGARPEDGEMIVQRRVEDSFDPIRLGGIGRVVANRIEEETKIESRATTLGYVQRGGSPCPFDRVFASTLGYGAAKLVANSQWGRMVAWQKGTLMDIAISEVAGGSRKVPTDHTLLDVGRSVDTCFGD